MSDYQRVAKQLGAVRRAWKRAAALAGLAIVAIEAVGILIVALLVDWVYHPTPGVRIALLAAVIVLLAYLLFRHVISPLTKKISDDQLALFVEEHSDHFEGALITATELERNGAPGTPKAITDAVVAAAVSRAGGMNVRSVVDLRRLKKYAMAAVAVVAAYGAMCLLFPETIGRHARRVMAPWHRTSEDSRDRFAGGGGKLGPVEFTLSRGDSKILRRGSFGLEATLSHASGEPVVLNFRPAGQANQPWRSVPMKEIERLNSFTGALNDVDEDVEFCVSTGADRSKVYKVGVFDALRLSGFEVKTEYPGYLQLPPRTEQAASADIMAPTGSKVTVKVLANTALTNGTITWADGKKQAMRLENGPEQGAATVSFDISKDTSYDFAVTDANGQAERSVVSCAVRALPDDPPKIEVKYPLSTVTASPLGEVTFAAEATDDLALAGVDLVYQRQLPMDSQGQTPPLGAPVRMPLKLSRAAGDNGVAAVPFPDVAQGTLRFALEDLSPRAMPEEIISYYLECRDRKGQVVDTDIQMIVVDRMDAWPLFDPKPPHGPTFKIVKNITEYLQATWKLQLQKATMKPEEFLAATKGLAETMINPETKRLYEFYERKRVPPEKVAHADRADKYIESGRQALLFGDAQKAVSDFRVVLAELTILKLDKNGVEMFTGDYGKKGAPQDYQKDLNKLFTQVQIEVDKIQPPANWNPKEAKAAEKIRKVAEDLAKKQNDVVKKAEEIAKMQGAGKPGDQQKAQDEDKEKSKANAEKQAKALASEQEKLAGETQKEAATTDPKDKHDDPELKQMTERMTEAAKAMRDAARSLEENKSEQAVADAKRAQGELNKVAERMEQVRQEKLAEAVAGMETKAAKLLKEQKELSKATAETAGKDAKDDKTEKEYKKLTYKQAQLQAETARFKKDVEELKNAAARDAKAETAKHLDETNKEMGRSEPDQKMVDAVVELEAKHGKEAGKEQEKAEKGLEKALTSLQKAGESLAADRESQLARAKEEAKRIDAGLKKLGADPGQVKVAATQKGPTTGPAVEVTKNEEKKGDEESKPLTEAEKKALSEDLSLELERLARHLSDRDFAEKKDQDYLSKAAADGRLGPELENDKAKRNEVAVIVRRVKDKLETEYQVTLESKKLAEAQREDCPPSYRQMVNKYYEALSETAR